MGLVPYTLIHAHWCLYEPKDDQLPSSSLPSYQMTSCTCHPLTFHIKEDMSHGCRVTVQKDGMSIDIQTHLHYSNGIRWIREALQHLRSGERIPEAPVRDILQVCAVPREGTDDTVDQVVLYDDSYGQYIHRILSVEELEGLLDELLTVQVHCDWAHSDGFFRADLTRLRGPVVLTKTSDLVGDNSDIQILIDLSMPKTVHPVPCMITCLHSPTLTRLYEEAGYHCYQGDVIMYQRDPIIVQTVVPETPSLSSLYLTDRDLSETHHVIFVGDDRTYLYLPKTSHAAKSARSTAPSVQ